MDLGFLLMSMAVTTTSPRVLSAVFKLRPMFSDAPTLISAVSYPTLEICNTSPVLTRIENLPLASVCVNRRVPFTRMVTPGKGDLESSARMVPLNVFS